MALLLMWGVVSFSSAQEIQVDEDCPPTSKNEGVESDLEYDSEGVEGEARIEGEGTESELEFEDNQAEFDSEIEQDGEAEIEYEDEQLEYNMETEEAAPMDTSVDMELEQSKDCPNGEATTSDADIEINNYEAAAPATTEVNVELEEEKERSTFGKIWRAPFKLVGNIPGAAVSIVSESAEGVGHIVGAPFKGVAKLFGADEDDNDELDENM